MKIDIVDICVHKTTEPLGQDFIFKIMFLTSNVITWFQIQKGAKSRRENFFSISSSPQKKSVLTISCIFF